MPPVRGYNNRKRALTYFTMERSKLFSSQMKGGKKVLLNHERIWIAGAKGQVGGAFAQLLDTEELDVLLTDKSEVDVANMDEVRKFAGTSPPGCDYKLYRNRRD